MNRNGTSYGGVFESYQERKVLDRLAKIGDEQSYYRKYRSFMWFVFALSILFNLASLLTASYAVYYIAEWLTEVVWASFAVSAICLLALEFIKRKSSSEFWQVFYWKDKIARGWVILAGICFAISLAASFYGTKKGTDNLAPPPTLVDAKEEQAKIQEQISYLKAENERLSVPDPHQGVPLLPAQRQMKKNGEVLAGLFERQNQLTEMLRGQNQILTDEYQQEVDNAGWILAGVSVFFEILFELCIWYVWYYYYRSYVEDVEVNPQLYVDPGGALTRNPSTKKNGNHFDTPTIKTRKTNEPQHFVDSKTDSLTAVVDVTKTIKDMRNWYRQTEYGKTSNTRKKAHDEYIKRRQILSNMGYVIEEASESSLTVINPHAIPKK